MTRLSSPNIHQSLYIASDNTIYMILGHSDCNMFTKNNNKKSTVYLLKLLHLNSRINTKTRLSKAPILSTHEQLVNKYDLIN